ncbi:MAG: RluA family pseudouridine synthase [Mycoplasmataceae bacterium]|jgi:23S rRNA pseudouridine1911/1915/1917 synthase|nr:RluA family pseudouridine synthase [Mycoplasmataceae bacterium]
MMQNNIIAYEDEDVIIIDKPRNMQVYDNKNSISADLLSAIGKSEDVSNFKVVQKLDKETNGLMVIAKNDNAFEFISKQISSNKMARKCLAIVFGNFDNSKLTINLPISYNTHSNGSKLSVNRNGSKAITEVSIIKSFNQRSLIECVPKSGGSVMQVRVHLAYIHHPVLNDKIYGIKNDYGQFMSKGKMFMKNSDYGHFLFVNKLSFIHPTTKNKVSFETKPDTFFSEALSQIEQ